MYNTVMKNTICKQMVRIFLRSTSIIPLNKDFPGFLDAEIIGIQEMESLINMTLAPHDTFCCRGQFRETVVYFDASNDIPPVLPSELQVLLCSRIAAHCTAPAII